MKELIEQAAELGAANFAATSGRVPDRFELLRDAAPATFAGYALMRAAVMRDRKDGGALDLKTKEFVFVLLDTLAGSREGAVAHLERAMTLGLTLEELAEGLTQVIMVGGITTWNLAGAEVMRRAIDLAAEPRIVPPPFG
ncbi:carboxymuconolactone decarboxylase family protein [Elioraea sp.]|uniref:carboxymuconolactone decarboxylase family protein n=1 Tax=Elioraea sp. TaxID=2185103 RepID=UPI00307F2D3F